MTDQSRRCWSRESTTLAGCRFLVMIQCGNLFSSTFGDQSFPRNFQRAGVGGKQNAEVNDCLAELVTCVSAQVNLSFWARGFVAASVCLSKIT